MKLPRILVVAGLIGALAVSLVETASASEPASFRWSDKTPAKCSAQMAEEVYFHPACVPAKHDGFSYASNPGEGASDSALPDTGTVKIGEKSLYAFSSSSSPPSGDSSASDGTHRRHARQRTALIVAGAVVMVSAAVLYVWAMRHAHGGGG